MRQTILRIAAAATLFSLLGCSPGKDAGIVGPSAIYTGNSQLPNPWIVYDDSLHAAISQLQVYQSSPYNDTNNANFSDTTSPHSGQYCMGLNISSYGSTQTWAGFAFLLSGPTDYSGGHFTTATFWARSDVPSSGNYTFAALGGPSYTEPLTTVWQQFTIGVPSNITAVTTLFYVGVGGTPPYTVYIDDLSFQ